MIDLTPFGFTPTENSAYLTLLALGPSTAYAVAKDLSIARANAYQALDALVAKQAARLVEESPRTYRAARPDGVLAAVTDRSARELDRLQEAIDDDRTDGADAIIELAGTRSIAETAARSIVQAEGMVSCLATPDLLAALKPALRARRAAGRPVSVWAVGRPGDPDDGWTALDAAAVERVFPGGPVLVAASSSAIAASGDPPSGYWTSDPALVLTIWAAIRSITGS